MNVTWYVARASGMVAFALLTTTVVARPRHVGARPPSALAALRGGGRSPVREPARRGRSSAFTRSRCSPTRISRSRVADLLVPGIAPYRPLATSLGIVAMELLAALALANLLRTRISYRVWRRTHYLNFAVWLLALAHGVTSGSDSDTALGARGVRACREPGRGTHRVARPLHAFGGRLGRALRHPARRASRRPTSRSSSTSAPCTDGDLAGVDARRSWQVRSGPEHLLRGHVRRARGVVTLPELRRRRAGRGALLQQLRRPAPGRPTAARGAEARVGAVRRSRRLHREVGTGRSRGRPRGAAALPRPGEGADRAVRRRRSRSSSATP